jgi:hypothetical protein
MIPLEKQVVSLELAKRLKELGVKPEGLFDWAREWSVPLSTQAEKARILVDWVLIPHSSHREKLLVLCQS